MGKHLFVGGRRIIKIKREEIQMKKINTAVIARMIEELRAMNARLDEAGGPSAAGGLFEEVIGIEEEILTAAGLPATSDNCMSLFEGSVEEALQGLLEAKKRHDERGLHDHALTVLAEHKAGRDDPFNVLPLIGSKTHVYTLFLYSMKLMRASGLEEVDALLRELRLANRHLGALGKVILGGIRANRRAYAKLKGLGFAHLDECMVEEGSFDLAEAELDTEQLVFLARRAGNQGRFSDALRLCDRAVELDDGAPEALYLRALSREEMGDMDGAFEDYSRCILLDGEAFPAWVNRGRLQGLRGNMEAAVLDCSRAIEIDSGCAQAYVNRGNAFAALEFFAEAIDDFGIALRIEELAYVYVNRAMALLQLGKREEAMGDLFRGQALGAELAGKALREFFGIGA